MNFPEIWEGLPSAKFFFFLLHDVSHFFFDSSPAPRYNQSIYAVLNSRYLVTIYGEIMMLVKRLILFGMASAVLLLIGSFSGSVSAQGITAAQEQEFADAQGAVNAARKAKAEKYALETFKQAQDLLVTADHARRFKDGVKFTQASRLARAYAELAKVIAELKSEEEKLAATQEELEKARAEVDRLKKSQ